MTTIVHELGGAYAQLYRALNRHTLGLFPLLAGWKLFWLIPGVGLFDAARALRHGEPTARAPRRELIASWVFVGVVLAYSAWRRLSA